MLFGAYYSMDKKCSFGNFTIEPVDMGMETNYLVIKENCYVCRLTPTSHGWEVAEYDRICKLSRDEIRRISEFIERMKNEEAL